MSARAWPDELVALLADELAKVEPETDRGNGWPDDAYDDEAHDAWLDCVRVAGEVMTKEGRDRERFYSAAGAPYLNDQGGE